jgi:probable rRNA maturation factor
MKEPVKTIEKARKLRLFLQIAPTEKTKKDHIPKKAQFLKWINIVLDELDFKLAHENSEITVRIVDEKESAFLNKKYRGRSNPTNVLSFPVVTPNVVDFVLLGDLAICASIVEKEALFQNKKIIDHWAHLTIHGVLHLLGYDHEKGKDAKIMEDLEIKILHKLGIANPY